MSPLQGFAILAGLFAGCLVLYHHFSKPRSSAYHQWGYHPYGMDRRYDGPTDTLSNEWIIRALKDAGYKGKVKR